MKKQRFFMSVFLLMVLMAFIGGANHYFFQTGYISAMPGVEMVKVPEKKKLTFNPDIYAGTMEQIRGDRQGQGLMGMVTARNPFLWPGESTDQAAALSDAMKTVPEVAKVLEKDLFPVMDKAEEVIVQAFDLTMVIVGEKRNLALVNNHFVTEGSRIEGYKVVKIEPETVFLVGSKDRRTLTLEPGGPLEYHRVLNKNKAPEKDSSVSQKRASLDLETQLKDVMKLYPDPNLLLK